MCGLTGFWEWHQGGIPGAALAEDAARMAATLVHRGPDDSGVWVESQAGVALAFRRLAILDLSPTGHQPMLSPSGRYAVVFNGEIYNYLRLKAMLESQGEAPPFRGSSDTEVLLACVEAWGLATTLQRCVGMFAIALYDRQNQELMLARDRLGVKPLYVAHNRERILFGSQLKALEANPRFHPTIDLDAAALYFHYACIPAPYTIYQRCRKVMPGTIELYRHGCEEPEVTSWWDPVAAFTQASQHPFQGSLDEAADQLDILLADATRLRMLADVPLGAFLSGGIDSSMTVSAMQRLSTRPVKTFTIGFTEALFNEASFARDVARHLGTDHTELFVTASDAAAVIPNLPDFFDEPFADSSQIPTFLVSKLARKSVTVVLSGDGADELFGGYGHHFSYAMIWDRKKLLPTPLVSAASKAIRVLSPETWDRLLSPVSRSLPERYGRLLAGEKLYRLSGVLGESRFEEYLTGLLSQVPANCPLVPNAHPLPLLPEAPPLEPPFHRPLPRMLFHDLTRYLPNDIMAKVDRASMAVSLEVRSPFLDHRLAEFAWGLPDAMKLRNGTGKVVLRQLLHRRVPRGLVERPKAGFAVPIGDWVAGPLRDWAESLLAPNRIRRQGILNPAEVSSLWQEHLSGRRPRPAVIWSILMFQAWLENRTYS